MTSMDQERWLRVKDRLRIEVGEDIYMSWFARMELDAVETETIKLSVPTRFLRARIPVPLCREAAGLLAIRAAHHHADRADRAFGGDPAAAAEEIQLAEPPPPPREAKMNGHEPRGLLPPISAVHEGLGGSPLDPRLTFDAFVVGRSNTLAHAAALQVARGRRGDAVMFNPLYIHAGVGLGKTHLLQAVAWAGNVGPERKVLYLTAKKFMYELVAALRAQTAIAFKEALRAIDVLVIDDLQFLQGKSTQAEFCHTLPMRLIDSGGQVVIASDRPPSDLESLDERMRSRLAGGLVVDGGAGRGAAAGNPQIPGGGGTTASSRLRRAGGRARVHRQGGHAQRPRSGRCAQPPARPQQAHRPASHAGDGGARGARPDPAAGGPAGSRSRRSSGWWRANTM